MVVQPLWPASSIGGATNSGSDGCNVINLYNMGDIKLYRSSVERMRLSVQNPVSVQIVPQLSNIVNFARSVVGR
jgi:hypothetical protein